MKIVFMLTVLFVVPVLGLIDSVTYMFTGATPELVDRWAQFCGVDGHDPELF